MQTSVGLFAVGDFLKEQRKAREGKHCPANACVYSAKARVLDQMITLLNPSLSYVMHFLAVLSSSWCQKDDRIIRNDFEGPNPDGSYKWAIQTEGGIFHEQRGSLQPSVYGSPDPALVVEGQYQYVAPDGQVINLLYKADENGFQPTGDHLPTPPPIPPAIARALAYLATKPPPTDSDY